jgi:hypothetical protein
MSNFVYGYIKTYEQDSMLFEKLKDISNEYTIGIKPIKNKELYGFPDSLKPSEDKENIYYINITDSPEKTSAEYLIDFIDYAEEADFKLPKIGKERLNILLNVIKSIINLVNTKKMVIAMTESNEIESIQKVQLEKIYDVIIGDFINYPPPNKIYIFDKV